VGQYGESPRTVPYAYSSSVLFTKRCARHGARDCNPRLEFSIPGFGIVEFPMPGSRRDWRSIVKTTKIARWVGIRVAIFELQVCTIVLSI